jgi:membrane-associated PAP2 superfamily phosphatase
VQKRIKMAGWPLGTAILLIISYFVCQYPLIDLHGMGEWPFDLLVFGLIVISIAFCFNARKVMICVLIGYIVGFIIGVIFQVDTYDSINNFMSNNLWILWTITMLGFIFCGIVFEIIKKYLKKSRYIKKKGDSSDLTKD